MNLQVRKVLVYIAVIIILVITIFPLFWIAMTSIKTRVQVRATPPIWFFKPIMDNYWEVLFEANFLRNILNSFVVCTISVILSMTVAVPAAYALARYSFSRKKDLMFWILSTRMAPTIGVAVPYFLITQKLGLIDTHIALVVVYLTFNISFIIWMMKGFFEELPPEIEEAALVDGCSVGRAFVQISLPLVAPGLVAVAIFSFLFSWNEFLLALILTREAVRTVPVGVAAFIGKRWIQWEVMSAATCIAIAPIFIFALVIRKYLARGLSFGSIR